MVPDRTPELYDGARRDVLVSSCHGPRGSDLSTSTMNLVLLTDKAGCDNVFAHVSLDFQFELNIEAEGWARDAFATAASFFFQVESTDADESGSRTTFPVQPSPFEVTVILQELAALK